MYKIGTRHDPQATQASRRLPRTYWVSLYTLGQFFGWSSFHQAISQSFSKMAAKYIVDAFSGKPLLQSIKYLVGCL